MNQNYKKYVTFFAVIILFAVYFMGLFVDLTGDSGLYAAITRQMVESGDWFILKIHNEFYDQKPHLLFWLAGIGVKLFENTNFAFKLFPAIYGGLTFYFIYRLGKFLYGHEAGKIAALLLASSQISFLYFFDIHTDTILQTGVVLAIWQLLVYLKNQKTINFIFGFVGVGLAMFSKGPVGAIIPFFVVLFYLLVSKDFNQIFKIKWFLGILISLLIVSPTLIHLFKSFGWEGIKFFFITNNFGRISGEYAGSSNDVFYYLYNFLWAFLPFTFLALYFLFREIKSWKNSKSKPFVEKSLVAGVGIFLIILSVAKGKGPNYFLPVFPVFALLSAKWTIQISKNKQANHLIKIQKILLVVFIIFFSVVFYFMELESKILPIVMTIILLVVGMLFLKQAKNFYLTILFSTLIFSLINLYAVSKIIPELYSYQGAKQALEIFESEGNKNDILINLHVGENELFYYANSNVKQFKDWDDYYRKFRQKRTWIYTNQGGFDGIKKLKVPLYKVYVIKNTGMNNISFSFINPRTRENSLSKNYLIKIHE